MERNYGNEHKKIQNVYVCTQPLSCVQLFAAPWTIASQAPQSIFQARILELAVISFSRGSSLPRNQTYVPCIFCIDIIYH